MPWKTQGSTKRLWIVLNSPNSLTTLFSKYLLMKLTTRIRIFVNPQLFLSRFKNFPVHTLSDSLRIYYFPLWWADSKISGFAGCVWTLGKPCSERKSCALKKIRIRVDGPKYPKISPPPKKIRIFEVKQALSSGAVTFLTIFKIQIWDYVQRWTAVV